MLTHLTTQSFLYTWYNGRLGFESVAQILDWAIYNEEWLDFWKNISCCALVGH